MSDKVLLHVVKPKHVYGGRNICRRAELKNCCFFYNAVKRLSRA